MWSRGVSAKGRGVCWLAASVWAACNPYGLPPPADGNAPAEREVVDPNVEAVFDSADQQRLIARIDAERREHGRKAMALAHDEPAVRSAIGAMQRGAEPLPALRTAMERLAQTESTTVLGFSVEANDLDQAPFPTELVEREEPLVAIVVIRKRTAPRYAIFYVLVEEGDGPEPREG